MLETIPKYERIRESDIHLYEKGGWKVVCETDIDGSDNWRLVKENSPANCSLRPYPDNTQFDPPRIHGNWMLAFDDPNNGEDTRNAVGVMGLEKGKMLAHWCDGTSASQRNPNDA